jgi:hypothetical protein
MQMQQIFVALLVMLALSSPAIAQQRIAVTHLDGVPITDGARARSGSTVSGTCDYSYNPMYLHSYRVHLTLRGESPGNPNDWVICDENGTWSTTLSFSTGSYQTPTDVYYTFHAYPCPSTMSCAVEETWDLKIHVDPFHAYGSIGGNSSNRTLAVSVDTAKAADGSDQEVYLAAMLGGQIYWIERGDQVVGDDLCKTPGTYSLRNTGSTSLVGCYQYQAKPYASATSFGRVASCAGTTTCSASLSFNLGPMSQVGMVFVAGTGADMTDLLTNQRYTVLTTY